jgi:ectoine hydroxylase-related dioxygenase (phytanoyl-CoA dioxygenase family)
MLRTIRKVLKGSSGSLQGHSPIKVSPKPVSRIWYMQDQESAEEWTAAQGPSMHEHLQSFFLKGYIHLQESISPQLCDKVLDEFHRLRINNKDLLVKNGVSLENMQRVVNLHIALPSLLECWKLNKGIEVLQSIFGSKPALYTSLFFEKGSEQDIHRDTPYFWTQPGYNYVGFWVALEDATLQNGALTVVPGGHRLPEINRKKIPELYYTLNEVIDPWDPRLWEAYQGELQRQCQEAGLKEEVLEVKKGDLVIWHPQLPHGGTPVRQRNATRYSFVVHATPPGMNVFHQDAFFRPQSKVKKEAPWKYADLGSSYVRFEQVVDFNHQKQFRVSELI